MNMSKIAKIAIASSVAWVTSQSALAEQSGVIIGAEVGYGGASVRDYGSYSETVIATGQTYNGSGTTKYDGGGVKYGFIVGYKHFFTPKLGLRAYANISAMHPSLTTKENVTNQWKKVSATMLNYGVNVDFLGNFISLEKVDFGGFVGLGLGANTWLGKSIDDYQKFIDKDGYGWKLNKTGFDVALNVGLRANIAKYHGVELVARVPFVATTILNKSATNAQESYNTVRESRKDNLHNPYSISLRYVVSF